jgi:hypothetical protein
MRGAKVLHFVMKHLGQMLDVFFGRASFRAMFGRSGAEAAMNYIPCVVV